MSSSFCAIVALSAALGAMPRPQAAVPAQAARGGAPVGSWSREDQPAAWRVGLQFTNFNGDRLSTSFTLDRSVVEQATAEFGFTHAEMQAIFDGCKRCDQAEYDRRVAEHYRSRGLTAVQTPTTTLLAVNMAELVRRNAPRLRAAAAQVERIALERHYDSTATIGAVLALAQTSLAYYRPPMQEGGKEIMGLYVPPQVLATGKGDCDSKTGLVASVLRNFSGAKLIGVDLPDHYLLGIARVPLPGQAYVEYGGDQYVLLEPAGPAWLPPGTVADSTLDLLRTRRDVQITPFR